VRPRRLVLAFGMLLIAFLVPGKAAGVEIVKDGSFESTPPSEDNPNWSEGWLAFPPICDVETCGEGGGTVGPRKGKNWVWFGGTLTPEEQFVAQDVTIPAGAATLTFYLWLGAASGNNLDVFRVTMDGRELIEVVESATGYGSYTLVSLDVSLYTGTHELSFDYQGFGGGATNFSLDDISLQAGPVKPKTVTLTGPTAVAKGKKATLKAEVKPCAGHEGDTIELYRGKKRVASVASDGSCSATFKVKIKKTSKFKAVSPKQDADHGAGTSKKLKVRARS
jgi:hypothetical protein